MLSVRHLHDLTAADLMSREVMTIPQEMSLQAAAHLLAQLHLSGAPVVDHQGRCVGVLTKTDLVRFLDKEPARAAEVEVDPRSFSADWEMCDFETLPADDVRPYMSTNVVTAGRDAPVAELARIMNAGHIHRVIIVDLDRRVVGIVSSLDILAAVAADVPEA